MIEDYIQLIEWSAAKNTAIYGVHDNNAGKDLEYCIIRPRESARLYPCLNVKLSIHPWIISQVGEYMSHFSVSFHRHIPA